MFDVYIIMLVVDPKIIVILSEVTFMIYIYDNLSFS